MKLIFFFLTIILILTSCASPTPLATPTLQPLPTTTHPREKTTTNTTEQITSATLTPKLLSTSTPSMQLKQLTSLGKSTLTDVAVSRDNKKIAVAFTYGIYLYETNPLRKILFIEGMDAIKQISFNKEGNLLVITYKSQPAQIWDTSNGKLSINLAVISPADRYIFLPERDLAISVIESAKLKDGKATIWNSSTGEIISELVIRSLKDLAINPTGTLLASISNSDTSNGFIFIWRIADGKEIKRLEPYKQRWDFFTFHPNGHLFASIRSENTIAMWELTNPTPPDNPTHEFKVEATGSIKFNQDGTEMIIREAEGNISILNATNGELLRKIYKPEQFSLFKLDDEANSVTYTAFKGGSIAIKIFDIKRGRLLQALEEDDLTYYGNLNSNGTFTQQVGDLFRIWDLSQQKIVRSLEAGKLESANQEIVNGEVITLPPIDFKFYQHSVVSLDGKKKVFFRNYDSDPLSFHLGRYPKSDLYLWDKARGDQPPIFLMPNTLPASLAFSTDSRYLAVSIFNSNQESNEHIRIWQIDNQIPIQQIPVRSPMYPSGIDDSIYDYRRIFLSFSHDHKYIFYARYTDPQVLQFEISTGKENPFQIVGGLRMTCMAVSPNGSSLAVGYFDGQLKVFSLETKTLIASSQAHRSLVSQIVFTSDNTLTTTDEEHVIRAWTIE